MHISNQRVINRSLWRFWAGYILTMLLIGLVIYFSIVIPGAGSAIAGKKLAAIEQKDQLWAKMNKAANALGTMRDIENANPAGYQGLNSVQRLQVDTKDSEFNETYLFILKESKKDTAAFKEPLEVMNGLRAFQVMIKDVREKKGTNCREVEDRLKARYEQQIQQLMMQQTRSAIGR
jgi:hypothetical protein